MAAMVRDPRWLVRRKWTLVGTLLPGATLCLAWVVVLVLRAKGMWVSDSRMAHILNSLLGGMALVAIGCSIQAARKEPPPFYGAIPLALAVLCMACSAV
jgi:hypothetical protein